MSLDRLAGAARETAPAWDDERAARVLASAVARRGKRASRDRLLRRAAVACSVAGVVCVVLFRGASAPASPESSLQGGGEPVAAAHVIADGDGGYARD